MSELAPISSVWPSGSALATAALPSIVLAPGLFSTTMLIAEVWLTRWAISRAATSVVEPAASGTT